mgnify:CR=1 FL=1|jgi:phosphoribosylformylglycinamidine synthase
MEFLAKVHVTLKDGVNDPQGKTIMGGLKSLGFGTVSDVRMGRYLEVILEDDDIESAKRQVEEMCDRLLSNPVIEQSQFEIISTGGVIRQ